MERHEQELSQELPPPFWNVCARPETETIPADALPPGPLLRQRSLRTAQAVRELAQYRHPVCVPLLVDALGSKDRAVSMAAGMALVSFGDAAFYALARMAAEGKGRQREQAVICLGQRGDAQATGVLLKVLEQDRRERTTTAVLSVLLFTLLSFCPEWIWNRSLNSTLSERAAEALGRIGDVRAVPPLVRLTQSHSSQVAGAAYLALSQLLPLLTSLRMEQAGALPHEMVPALADLVTGTNTTLARQALGALFAIGDGRALAAVERLAETQALYDEDRRYLAEEARQLAPVLRERAKQDELRQTLLRGAVAPHTSPQELLRAAHANPGAQHHPNELLRPTQPGNRE